MMLSAVLEWPVPSCLQLPKHALQVTQDEDGFGLEAGEAGRLMARHYIRFNTMSLMCRAPLQMQMIDAILLLAQVQSAAPLYLYISGIHSNFRECNFIFGLDPYFVEVGVHFGDMQ